MKLLIIGSGGREHALCLALTKSSQVSKIYVAPGNIGMSDIAQKVNISSSDHKQIGNFCLENNIDFVIIGPEAPLVAGLVDYLEKIGIRAFGPTKQAAILEASKIFTKNLCKKYNIPTAHYAHFDNSKDAKSYLKKVKYPIVIKVDGLAAGKGVIIAKNENEAIEAIDKMFNGQFGEAGKYIIIEEFLSGREISFFAICDGSEALFLGAAEDYKRAFDNDQGPNTGGMGSFSPSEILDDELKNQVMNSIIYPTIEAMKNENRLFRGILFAGLMITDDGPKLLEYNVRFGDPETESVLLCLQTDLLSLLLASASGTLNEIKIEYNNYHAVCVIMAAKGYPGNYKTDTLISNLSEVAKIPEVIIFHAGTKGEGSNILATGGRVLAVTAIGNSREEARKKAYDAIQKINWPEGFYRTDIASNRN